MLQLYLLVGFFSVAAAYDCNVTLVGGTVSAESSGMCDYMNYHVSMFLFFGSAAVMFMLVALVHIAWYGPNANPENGYTVQWYVWWVLGCLILMPGFEFVVAMFYVCVATLVIASVAYSCISGPLLFRRSNAVTSVVNTPAVVTVVVAEEAAEPCCICLETGVSGPWFFAPCKHSFHLECIQKWSKGTCPLCRKRVWT